MTYKNRKLRKSKKNKTRGIKKMKGGNGIGSNCSDPNFSIYNTNLLKLFPYKGGTKEEDNKREREREIKKSKQLQQRIQEEFMVGRTPITDPVELKRLERSIVTEAERDKENKRIIDILEKNKTKLVSFPTTPMTQKDIQRLEMKNKKDFQYLNSKEKKKTKLRISDLASSTRKSTKTKTKKGGDLTIEDQYKNKEGPHR